MYLLHMSLSLTLVVKILSQSCVQITNRFRCCVSHAEIFEIRSHVNRCGRTIFSAKNRSRKNRKQKRKKEKRNGKHFLCLFTFQEAQLCFSVKYNCAFDFSGRTNVLHHKAQLCFSLFQKARLCFIGKHNSDFKFSHDVLHAKKTDFTPRKNQNVCRNIKSLPEKKTVSGSSAHLIPSGFSSTSQPREGNTNHKFQSYLSFSSKPQKKFKVSLSLSTRFQLNPLT